MPRWSLRHGSRSNHLWEELSAFKPPHPCRFCAYRSSILHRVRSLRSYFAVGCASRVGYDIGQFKILELPAELLHLIVECAPTEDAISLKLCCRALYHCGPPLSELIIRSGMARDSRVGPVCITHRVLKMHEGKVFCRGCMSSHHAVAFTREQLLRDGAYRRCIGSSRYLLTPDYSISFRQQLWMASKFNTLRFGFQNGPILTANDDGYWPIGYRFSKERGGFWLIYGNELDLDSVPDLSNPREALRTQLKGKWGSLCPHITPSPKDLPWESIHSNPYGSSFNMFFAIGCSGHMKCMRHMGQIVVATRYQSSGEWFS